MKDTKFDFMAFGYSAGDTDIFVAHAAKYTPQDAVDLFIREYGHRFVPNGYNPQLRKPTVSDVQEARSAYRFGYPEWPDGCYTLVGDGEAGSFPVWIIDFEKLRSDQASQAGEVKQDERN
ncbi:hypothetical protein SDC9_194636 [bioreactor metagenome]|uniref:Uncharacterized protein n=1 Tax=bioreactor metagenome TaxID=1076179 RepID=A0A645I804_9ZZZZ